MRIFATMLVALALVPVLPACANDAKPEGYRQLLLLFEDWRTFERPPMRSGAPDYTEARVARRKPAVDQLRQFSDRDFEFH